MPENGGDYAMDSFPRTTDDHVQSLGHRFDTDDNDNFNTRLLSNGSHNVAEKLREEEHKVSPEDLKVEIDQEERKPLIYRISQRPPWHLLCLFAIQQSLLAIGSPLSITIIVSEVVCAQRDDSLKTQLLSASFFMAGISTIVMTTFGVRLPIFQGPASTYLIPLIAMSHLPEWSCPETFEGVDPVSNKTMLLATVGNGTVVPARQISEGMLAKLSGSLIVAGVLHFLIGATGLVGILTRFIGPITIVPTIMLVGLYIYKLFVKFCETSWLISGFTFCVAVTLALFLSNRLTPIPLWTRKKGFHIIRYPLHQVFSVLFTIIIGWAFSAILTSAGVLSDDPDHKEYFARTDSRSYIIEQTDWFIFPYPGKLSSFTFSTGAFISFLIATLSSVLDSIGDYNASARTARVSPPPNFAFNRGIAAEGLMSILSGSMGCCHATVSYGGNIGAMGITRVVSRSVFQMCGLVYIIFAVFGKIGAAFITIPYAVLGGSSVLIIGIFIGLVFSYLQTIDLNSTRNLAILGTSLLLGLMMPYWCEKNPDALDTGYPELTNAFQMLLSNPSFVGGFFAFVMDNTVPGTLKERGLLDQMKELNDEDAKELAKSYEDGPEAYRLPWIPERFRRSTIFKYIPIFEYTGDEDIKK